MKTRRTKWGNPGLAIVAAILTTGPAGMAGDAWWTNWSAGASGEYWTNTLNWTNAAGANVLPDNGHACLTRTNASYTVLYDTAAPAISNLFVQNKAGNTTTLIISNATLSHLGGYISLSNGAVVYVTNNAVWKYPGTNSTADRLMDITGGAELNVCGGSVQFTNLLRATTTQKSYIYVGNGSTGTLRVASGQFNYYDPFSVNDSQRMYVGDGAGSVGAVQIGAGAALRLGYAAGQVPLYVGRYGGRGSMVVEGDLVFTNATPFINIGYGYGSYASGELVVTNGGRIFSSGGSAYVGIRGDCYGALRFYGTNYMTVTTDGNGWSSIYVGGNATALGSGAGCSTGLLEIASGAIKMWGMLAVGFADGSTTYSAAGTMNIYGGTVSNNAGYGTWVGEGCNGGNAVGTLNMTGGVMLIASGSAVGYPSPGYAVCGLTIGMIHKSRLAEDPSPDTRAKGTFNMSGGAITNNYDLAIGCNGATGTVIQTGGTMRHAPVDTNRLTLIGYGYGTNAYSGAGNGTYDMSGGTFTTPNRVFVGGVSTNTQWYAKSGAVGLLKVSGGSFTVQNTLYVGENGSGTVTMGSNGVLTVGNLYATNAASKLRFELGAGGIGTFTVTNELRIGSGTTLEVDISKFRQPGLTKLLDCKTRTGSFADGNIAVTGGKGAVVQTKDEDIYLNLTRGTVISIK